MKFSFVILTWNRKAFLEKCVFSLLESIDNFDDTEIIVMDNGSSDETVEFLSTLEKDKRLTIIKLRENYGLSSYKKLFNKARGENIVVVDDDVISFPPNIKRIFADYLKTFSDFGFLALDVVQNEQTNGAKPAAEFYTEIEKDGKIIQQGPAGGWCSCFRRKDYRKIKILFNFKKIDMKFGEDSLLSGLFLKWLNLKSGIIKGKHCLHASGPYYSKEYGYLDRDIEKYRTSELDSFVKEYEKYKENGKRKAESGK